MKIYKNLDINDLENEVWKVIEDFPDYSVSNLGRVKSFKKYHGTNERILRQSKNIGKYLKIDLRKNGIPKTKQVHRLVYETHIEKLKEGYDAHHINEDKENNFVDNLESKPHPEHLRDHNIGKIISEKTRNAMSKGKKGEYNPNYKISNQKYINIEVDIEKRELNGKEIAKKYGVSQMTISRIKSGKRKIKCGD